MKCLGFLILISLSFSLEQRTREGRILGGWPTSIEEHPHQLSLTLIPKTFLCGAILIKSEVALTAAHCEVRRSWRPVYRIRAGSDYVDRDGIVVGVKEFVAHPKFDSRNYWNDIAVLILAQKLEYGPKIHPITLAPPDYEIRTGMQCYVTGWGVGSGPKLEMVEVPVPDQFVCKLNYGSFPLWDGQLCAGYDDGGRDACQGDSGGPLVSQGMLLGIVSYGEGCAEPGLYGIYTKVPAYHDFIRPYLV